MAPRPIATKRASAQRERGEKARRRNARLATATGADFCCPCVEDSWLLGRQSPLRTGFSIGGLSIGAETRPCVPIGKCWAKFSTDHGLRALRAGADVDRVRSAPREWYGWPSDRSTTGRDNSLSPPHRPAWPGRQCSRAIASTAASIHLRWGDGNAIGRLSPRPRPPVIRWLSN